MRTRRALIWPWLAAMLLPLSVAPAQRIIVLKGDTNTGDSARRDDHEQKPVVIAPATLHWNNGESMTGEPTGATNDSLVWNSPLFDDPLELSWSVLHRVDKNPADSTPADAFAFVLRDGSRIYGEPTGVTADAVTLRSTRHGDVALRREEVVGAWRVVGKRLVYAGPWGESGWSPAPNIRVDNENPRQQETLGKVPTGLTGPGGSLVLPFWHRTLTNPLALPDRAEVEFRLHARDQPEFQLVLDGREKSRLRIETWGREVVLATAKDFETIYTLDSNDRSVELRVCWDRPARRCQVYTSAGVLLKEWKVPANDESGPKPAVLIANKGHDLTLDFLRIREWDGQPLAAIDSAQARVELDDGRVVAGTVDALDGGVLKISTTGDEPVQAVSLADADAIIFSRMPAWGGVRETTLTCSDGTILRGQIGGFEGGRALLKTTFADAPLPVKIDDLRQLFVRNATPADSPPEVKLDGLDKIVVRGVTLHGHLVAAFGADSPRWLPIGGRGPVTPAKGAVCEITRFFPPDAPGTPATSLLYTRLGDALPGVLHGLDRQGVDFDSPWIEAKHLEAAEMEAVQFDSPDKGSIESFDAPGWQVLKGEKAAVREKSGMVKLLPDTVVGHPGAAQEGEVKFTYDTDSFSCLRVRLFCEGVNPARSLNYLLMRSGNRLSSGVEMSDGQFNNQHQTSAPSGPVQVRLVIDEKSVRFYFNEALAETVWFPASKRAGAGLLLESTSVWGNPSQELGLSKFSASSPIGRSYLVSVNAGAKTQALTVPRFRKEDPPRHALLASNGDVLRGEIVALTNTQIGFRIGLETLRVPRERVAALIALQPPALAPAGPDAGEAAQKILEKHVGLQTWYSNVGYGSLLSIVRQSVPELKFQLPTEPDGRRVQFRFDNQTVGEMLDTICEQFELHYHLEKGVVILEARGGKPEANLVRKTYWLKSDPFAGHGSAAEVFAAKDVPFPKGASAEWQASSRSLEVTNTAANVDKIGSLLANELGGSLGSPTHWLLLRNGGRIGLVVEKFEPDFVQGIHPIYGRCKIPLADVLAVRNTLPEPTAAARAVSGWRLVDAPEPVLPESGGENSDLLGKDAPTFKLKTLAGEEFDLTQEKGHVVVLDFWATWCGPCIKSLPGLIEAMGKFPADKVVLIGVNQAEAPAQVKRFLETHGWQLNVALDAGQAVAKQYGVDGIPHTVIIGPDGKVAWTQTGFSADGEEKATEAVKKLLGGG